MNKHMLKSILLTLALVAGLLWGYQAEPALAVPTTCCTQCNDYCYCENQASAGYPSCRALNCDDTPGAGTCWGMGSRCCLGQGGP